MRQGHTLRNLRDTAGFLDTPDAETPGYEPAVGNRLMKTVVLRKAQTWDQAVACGHKIISGYEELFANKKVPLPLSSPQT